MINHEQLEQLKNNLEEGDILFTSIPHALYRAVEKGTNSPTSHVGIAIKHNGQWVVAESKVPFSKLSSLESFIHRSHQHWLSIKRLKSPLSNKQKAALKASCLSRLGKVYDFGFNYNSSRQFCSKFVYDSYLESCDISIGQLEKVDTLLAKCPSATLPFWKLWFCGFIPKENVTVTPQSQYIDNKLKEVNYHA